MSWENPVVSSSGNVGASVPHEVMLLAGKLQRVHGDVRITKEKNGFHIYFASPKALELYGRIELEKMHCCVNADKALGLGTWRQRAGTYDMDLVGRCMKTSTSYRLSGLLRMPNLAARGIQATGSMSGQIRVNDTSRSLVRDERGNLVPERPGDTTMLTMLPPEHPAIQYLMRRGYDIPSLVDQTGASWCWRETPEDKARGIGYRNRGYFWMSRRMFLSDLVPFSTPCNNASLCAIYN